MSKEIFISTRLNGSGIAVAAEVTSGRLRQSFQQTRMKGSLPGARILPTGKIQGKSYDVLRLKAEIRRIR